MAEPLLRQPLLRWPDVRALRRRVRWMRYFGPAFLVSVGYMDPGNWATDIEAGSRFGYSLLWVITLSSLMAIFLQILAAKLGLATGKDLATLCREQYRSPWRQILFLTAALAMMATDLAEFMGVALALNLLFGIPLAWAALITFLDVLLILYLERFGFRIIELVIIGFVAAIGLAYVVELAWAQPDWGQVARHAFWPDERIGAAEALFVAVGILGATVMPHNLYLHSAQVRNRLADGLKRERLYRLSVWDTILALNVAWLINSSILIVSSAVFHENGVLVTDIDQAYRTLEPLLGKAAALTFALALLASGISSSTTATLAGQYVFQGFLRLDRLSPALIRLGTRTATMLPALLAIWLHARPMSLLVLSQVILSFQLPFAVIPLVRLTSRRDLMGELVNKTWQQVLGWVMAACIVGLNLWLLALGALGH
ncbi:MAG: Nramp family divalent metal transporter [Bacteroidetes bacterium]|nr:Nramp family divalent metal transporter [Bacteroidota bacterium]MCX7905922.1 Nramp family divalent metal transporter [Bacteroidota bacterium]MDW8138111.1 Nramp family divalent metal transporter [Bacteroidota bacterium]